MPEPPWILAFGTIITGVGALWLNSRKDHREATADSQSARRAAYDLDQDLRGELDKIWTALVGQRQALFAVAASIRTDASIALKAGDLAAAAAHQADADRVETALLGPTTP